MELFVNADHPRRAQLIFDAGILYRCDSTKKEFKRVLEELDCDHDENDFKEFCVLTAANVIRRVTSTRRPTKTLVRWSIDLCRDERVTVSYYAFQIYFASNGISVDHWPCIRDAPGYGARERDG